MKSIFKNETLRNGVFFTLFSFINKGINFVLLILLAIYISPTEYGYWSLFGTVVMFIGYFIAMTTEGYITIAYFKEGMPGIKESFSCILPTTLIVSGVLFSITTLFGDYLQQLLNLPCKYLYLAIGIAFFTVYSNICLNYLRIKKKIVLYGIFSCSSAFLVFGLSIFLVKYCLMGWEGCVQAQFISVLLFGAIGLCFFLFSKKIGKPNRNYWMMMLAWGFPLIPHLATNFIQLGCDRYIINFYHNIEQVGLFSFAYSLSAAITIIGSGFNDANSVNIYEILGNKTTSAKQKIALLNTQKKNVFLVYLCSSIAVIILCYILIPLILPQYTSAIKYFFFLSIYAFLQCVYYLYTNFLFYFKQTKKLMAITFSFSILHLVLSLVFTQSSIIYTCIVFCVSQLGIVFFVRKQAIKALKENMNCSIRFF